jgi:ABC-type amino acid transport system permease subunit
MFAIVQQFIPILWAGFLVNLEIGVAAVAIGTIVGVALTLLRRRLSLLQRPVHLCIQLMQALPTYVTMFFVLTLLPDDLALWGRPIVSVTAVVLAQSSPRAKSRLRIADSLHALPACTFNRGFFSDDCDNNRGRMFRLIEVAVDVSRLS